MKHTAATASAIARQVLRDGDAVLEVGAADGAYTQVYADHVGRTGHVLAVEPHRPSVQALRTLADARPWITVWHGAVGPTAGLARFYPDQTNPKRSSLWPTNVPDPGQASIVPVTTIDALVASMPQLPGLIQVDAQGAEAGILAGAIDTLARPIVWVIELWASGLRQAGSSVAEVLAVFKAHAYRPRSVRGARLEWDAACAEASARRGPAHLDLVMVPAALAGVQW